MRKILYCAIFILAVGVFFQYGGKISQKTSELAETLNNNSTISEIKKEISTSGPLRGPLDSSSQSNLTISGVIKWTNVSRQQNGDLPPLSENIKLNQAAQAKVKDMFAKQYFEHISPSGKGPADLAENVHYEYIAVGENLALGNFKDDKALVEAWMNSPGHRANILNSKYLEIGVAVGKGTYEGKTTWLAVQEFGKPLSSCPSVDSTLKLQIESYKSETESLNIQIKEKKQELDSQDPKTKQEVEEYNRQVAEYNALIKIYNNKIDILKGLISSYNNQVNAFNLCAGS